MKSRLWKTLFWCGVATLFALGVWFRVSSLRNCPGPIGDEACIGTQGVHLLRGEPVTILSPTKNIINPLLIAMQLPLHVLFKPSFSALRAPAALSGVLAVVLAYVLGARMLDRATALIAAGLLAVLPIAIIFSRIGWESCQVPLFGVLILYFAWTANRTGLLLAFAASFLAHPTTVFLAPLFLGVLVYQMDRRLPPEGRVRGWVRITATAAVALAIDGALCYLKHRDAATKTLYKGYQLGKVDWALFFAYYRKMLLGFCQYAPTETSQLNGWLFWGVVGGVAAAGTWKLVRDRRWERLVLVAGCLVTIVGFHLAAGAEAIGPKVVRYGLVLVVPSVFAFACLLRPLLVVPSTPRRAVLLRVQAGSILAIGFVLLFGFKQNYFDPLANALGSGPESIWTFGCETSDPWRDIAGFITRDLGDAGGGRPARTVVVTQDWWSYRPVQYMLTPRRDIKVASVERVEVKEKARIVREQLTRGAYVVGTHGEHVDAIVRGLFPPDALREWRVIWFKIYRLKRPAERGVPRPADDALASQSAARTVR